MTSRNALAYAAPSSSVQQAMDAALQGFAVPESMASSSSSTIPGTTSDNAVPVSSHKADLGPSSDSNIAVGNTATSPQAMKLDSASSSTSSRQPHFERSRSVRPIKRPIPFTPPSQEKVRRKRKILVAPEDLDPFVCEVDEANERVSEEDHKVEEKDDIVDVADPVPEGNPKTK